MNALYEEDRRTMREICLMSLFLIKTIVLRFCLIAHIRRENIVANTKKKTLFFYFVVFSKLILAVYCFYQ